MKAVSDRSERCLDGDAQGGGVVLRRQALELKIPVRINQSGTGSRVTVARLLPMVDPAQPPQPFFFQAAHGYNFTELILPAASPTFSCTRATPGSSQWTARLCPSRAIGVLRSLRRGAALMKISSARLESRRARLRSLALEGPTIPPPIPCRQCPLLIQIGCSSTSYPCLSVLRLRRR